MKCVDVLSMSEEYGWIKVIENLSCNSVEEIGFFYQKAGALLAIADTLNYKVASARSNFARKRIWGESAF